MRKCSKVWRKLYPLWEITVFQHFELLQQCFEFGLFCKWHHQLQLGGRPIFVWFRTSRVCRKLTENNSVLKLAIHVFFSYVKNGRKLWPLNGSYIVFLFWQFANAGFWTNPPWCLWVPPYCSELHWSCICQLIGWFHHVLREICVRCVVARWQQCHRFRLFFLQNSPQKMHISTFISHIQGIDDLYASFDHSY